jgi:hypothetical protein
MLMQKALICLLAGLLSSRAASAACAVSHRFCEALPERSNPNAAIFLGLVKEVLPPPPLLIPSPPPGNPSPGLAPASRRRASEPIPELPIRYPVVRLQVIEAFVGVEPRDFEARLTSDHFLDGVPQQAPAMRPGEVWLVDAYRNQRDQQWYTGLCQRSKPAAQADEELRTLRAWAAGKRLPARFSGEMFNRAASKYVPGVRVYLSGEKQTFSTMSDDQGRFVIENVPPGVYQVAADVPLSGGPIKIDLTQA